MVHEKPTPSMGGLAMFAGVLVAPPGTLSPCVLRRPVAPRYTIDAFHGSWPRATLVIGLIVWLPAMGLAIGYFTYLYRSFRGKVDAADQHPPNPGLPRSEPKGAAAVGTKVFA